MRSLCTDNGSRCFFIKDSLYGGRGVVWLSGKAAPYLKAIPWSKVTPFIKRNFIQIRNTAENLISKIFRKTIPISNPLNLASQQRTRHILLGDLTGGGRLWPGYNGKTPFPQSWDGQKIMEYVSDIATDPKISWKQIRGKIGEQITKRGLPIRYQAIDSREGVNIKVIIEPFGEGIITAYPSP
ncbi:MAG: Rhs family protein [Segetibacter sp.]|nr:Rhs family protein [Segetibacter sp.]